MTKVFLERNLRELAAVDGRLADRVRDAERGPALAVVRSKAGPPSLKVGGAALHSVYDPVREAREWVEHHRGDIEGASSIAVLGFGLGYHVEELLCATDRPVAVFEPRIDILRAALEARELSSILSRARILAERDDLAFPAPGGTVAVLRHPPSVRLDPTVFEDAASRLEVLRVAAKGLRIAVVGPYYGGSLPVAGHCAVALRKLGHEVEFIDNSVYAETFLSIDGITESAPHRNILRNRFTEFASEAAMARIVPFRPDVVLVLAQAPFLEPALACLREKGIATAFWFVEDFRHMEYWRELAAKYDYFFAIQDGGFLYRLREAGAGNVAFLPMAASPEVHRKMELSPEELEEFGGDVSFVGAGYYNRRRLFEGLVDLDFRIWGNEWGGCPALKEVLRRGGARVDTEEIVKIFNASRININLHSSSYHEGVNPDGDFVNPRTFEIASCGGFQLVDRRSGLADLFRIGEEVACFDGLNDLRAKIAHYLARPEEREAVAEKGRQRVLRDHTYERRMDEMLGHMVRTGLRLPWKAMREREDPGRLIGEAGPGTELGKYLARFAGLRSLKLEDVVREIRSGGVELSRVERIFLAMKEIGRREMTQ
ncbi:MAG: glycosyltransferase [Deltaproteobacteria bacterium]|nr:glycosyltransferase [Deltaproteobacteria bacterium]